MRLCNPRPPARAAVMMLLAVLVLPGCGIPDRAGGLLSFEREAGAVPPAPQPTAEHLELRSAAADFSARVLARVHTMGAEPGAPAVEQATRAAEAVSSDVGKPAVPWPLPPAADLRAVPSVEARLIDYAAVRARAVRERREWVREVAVRSATPSRRSWRIASPALGVYLLFGVGGLGAALVAVGRRAWRWRKVALQLIPGIQRFLDSDAADAGELKEALSETTDRDVKIVIDRVKRGMGT